MKKILTTSFLAITGAFCMNANALTAVGSFNVAVSLQSQCQINSTIPGTTLALTDIPIAYTSFQTSPTNANTSFNVRCTNTLPFSLALDSGTGTASGISYVLALGTAAAVTTVTVAAPTLASQVGTGTNILYFINASAAAGQAGTLTTSTAPTAVNSARTVTITY